MNVNVTKVIKVMMVINVKILMNVVKELTILVALTQLASTMLAVSAVYVTLATLVMSPAETLTSVLMAVITVLVTPSVSTMMEVLHVPVRRVSSQLTLHLVAQQRLSNVLTRTNVN